MRQYLQPLILGVAAASLAACGSSGTTSATANSTARGTLNQNPPFRVASVNAADFQATLAANPTGAQLLQLTGNPVCGVDVYYFEYWTVAPANYAKGPVQPTLASGALMVPTGATGTCSGPRPIVEYAHGTQSYQPTNIANITDSSNTEGLLIAAAFAAQGMIVVAPNFVGYDISTLGYYPYLYGEQNAEDMIDALSAARTALPSTFSSATTDGGQLFLTGYSAGGYVAMATQRAMTLAGMQITAAAPMSGPYALEAFGDTIAVGGVNIGSTEFLPFITTAYQNAYGNIYNLTTDVYNPVYATGIQALLPSTTPIDTLFAQGKLPETQLFSSATPTEAEIAALGIPPAQAAQLAAVLVVPPTPLLPLSAQTPLFQLGFGDPTTPPYYLLTNNWRISYGADALSNPDPALIPGTTNYGLPTTAPTQTTRLALYNNDLRGGGWSPTAPTLMCGGDSDPTVYYQINTEVMQAFWSTTPSAPLVSTLDLNQMPVPPAAVNPYAPLQTAFQESQAALYQTQVAYYESAAGGSLPPAEAAAKAQGDVVAQTHAAEAPFCTEAAFQYFSYVLSLGG